MHIIYPDRAAARLYLKAEGFWGIEEALAFRERIMAAFAGFVAMDRPITILADFSTFPLQAADVAKVHADATAILATVPLHRHALVTPSALVRLQMKRILGDTPVRIFSQRDEAVTWLGWPDDYLHLLDGAREAAALRRA